MDRIVEQKFVEKVLQHQGNSCEESRTCWLYVKSFPTGDWKRLVLFPCQGGDDLSGELVFRHVDYERFLDMKRVIQMKNGRTRRRTGYKIHNRFVYGHFLAIAKQLSVGFTESVRDKIRAELKAE